MKSIKNYDVYTFEDEAGSLTAINNFDEYVFCSNFRGKLFVYKVGLDGRLTKITSKEPSQGLGCIFAMKIIKINDDECYVLTPIAHSRFAIWKFKKSTGELKEIFNCILPDNITNPKKIPIKAQPWGVDAIVENLYPNIERFHILITGAFAGIYYIKLRKEKNEDTFILEDIQNLYLNNYINDIVIVNDPNNNYLFYAYATHKHSESTFDPQSTNVGISVLAVTEDYKLIEIIRLLGNNYITLKDFINTIPQRNLLFSGEAIFDISNRENPTFLALIGIFGTKPCIIDENHFSIKGGPAGTINPISIVDISNPLAPVISYKELPYTGIGNLWTIGFWNNFFILGGTQRDQPMRFFVFNWNTETITDYRLDSIGSSFNSGCINKRYFAYRRSWEPEVIKDIYVFDLKTKQKLFEKVGTFMYSEGIIVEDRVVVSEGGAGGKKVFDLKGNQLLQTTILGWFSNGTIFNKNKILLFETSNNPAFVIFDIKNLTVNRYSMTYQGKTFIPHNQLTKIFENKFAFIFGKHPTLNTFHILRFNLSTLNIDKTVNTEYAVGTTEPALHPKADFSGYAVSTDDSDQKVIIVTERFTKTAKIYDLDLNLLHSINYSQLQSMNNSTYAIYFKLDNEELVYFSDYLRPCDFTRILNLTRNKWSDDIFLPKANFNYHGGGPLYLGDGFIVQPLGETTIGVIKVMLPADTKIVEFIDFSNWAGQFMQIGKKFYYFTNYELIEYTPKVKL